MNIPARRPIVISVLGLVAISAMADPGAASPSVAGFPTEPGVTSSMPATPQRASVGEELSPRELIERDLRFLASDELGGRLIGTDGARVAAAHIAAELEALGAEPLPGHPDYTVPFEFTAGVDDTGSAIEVAGCRWSSSGSSCNPGGATASDSAAEIRALSFSDAGSVSAGVVFAGYGLAIPEGQGYPYDNYAGLDVEDKVVVVLRYFPEDVDQEARAILSRYSGLRYKAMQARERGAIALLVLTGPRSPNAGELAPLSFDTAVAGSGILAGSISGGTGEALFAAAGKDLEATQAELDTGNPHVAGFDLGIEIDLEIALTRERRTGNNVVGYLPAMNPSPGGPGSKPFLVLGAHYDHLGEGLGGNSLGRDSEIGEIHNGSDDNASGVSAVLAAGRLLANRQRNRAVVLAFWSGEEMGLLGSGAFVKEAVIDAEAIAAYINFDMVGRMRDNRLVLQAVGSSAVWPSLIERANVPIGFDVQIQDDPYLPTDSSSFNQAGVPTLAFFTGSHEDYHRPTDDADTINYEDLERISRFGALLAGRVANLETPPEFVAVARSSSPAGDRDSVRAFTGTIPDYAADVEGLLLGGVIEGGPAQQAGLRGGDVIVEFAGQTISNIYDYTFALDAVKVDKEIQVVFLRDGERHEITMTPSARR